MGHFRDESAKMDRAKWVLLFFGGAGFLLFMIQFMLAWLYPVISSLYNKLVLFHVFHMVTIMATCMIRGGIVKPLWFALYVAAIVMMLVMDIVGCVWRTVLFTLASTSAANKALITFFIILEWLIVVCSAVMLILCFYIGKLTNLHFYLQDYVIGALCQINDMNEGEAIMGTAVKELWREYGIQPMRRRKSTTAPAGDADVNDS